MEGKEPYRDRLKKIASKKFDTTMIFPLSQFELAFSQYWGGDKPENELTDEEKANRIKWKECRNNILNLGNAQKRGFLAELDMHRVEWLRYRATLLPIDRYNNRNNQE